MKAIFDTSSLLAFVRYYLPFDTENKLIDFFKDKFEKAEIIILDKVLEESKGISKGIIFSELQFLSNTKIIVKTTELLPSQKFYNLLENQFCDKTILKLKEIDDVAFELEKTTYLKSPDANLIMYSMSIKSENPIIITEETKSANDNKIFKKIPTCCTEVGIECITLPKLLKDKYNLNLSELLK
jgi:Domain of unknown function (DUF4411)